MNPVDLSSLEIMGDELFGMTKEAGENNTNFIKRIFDCVGLKYPDNPDFIKSVNEMKEK